MLPKEAIEEFCQAYLKVHGKDIEPAKAGDLALGLINLLRIIFRPVQSSDNPDPPLDQE